MACLQRVQWFNAAVLTITPVLAVYGHWTTPVVRETFALCLAYYLFGMIGEYRPHVLRYLRLKCVRYHRWYDHVVFAQARG
jgi:hypothetical protein